MAEDIHKDSQQHESSSRSLIRRVQQNDRVAWGKALGAIRPRHLRMGSAARFATALMHLALQIIRTRSRLKIVSIPIGFGNRIIDVFSVESTGAVQLGLGFGRVVIEGMTYEEAEQAIADVLDGKFGSWLRHSRHPIVMVTDPPAK